MVRTPSIRVLVAALAVLPALLLSVALVSLLAVSTREISERLGTSMIDTATAQVRTDVGSFLAGAVRVSDLYTRRTAARLLPTEGLASWERPQLDDLVVNPGVASVSFGAATGETTWVLRREGHLELGRVTPAGDAQEFRIDPASGAIEPTPIRTYQYDPRKRPWYQTAVTAGAPTWTGVYFWFGNAGADSETGTGYTRPVARADGTLAGVLVVDVTLSGLSTFLKSLQFSKEGSIFIVDGQGLLVAASHGTVNSAAGERLSLASSGEPTARAVAAALAGQGSARTAATTLRLSVDGERVRGCVEPLHPSPGIDWSIIAVIPEDAFLRDAQKLQTRALLASAVAVAGALVLAFIFAGHLSRPLLAIVGHVRRVAEGDFASRLKLKSARELRTLSGELNRMAMALKDRMELQQSLAVAMQVQQSLLPPGPPKIAGLDIAGQSRYCDTTGGDYFDFIEVSDLPGGRLLVAVGDVMGHGIAAALLMATARAALRAHAWRHGALGELLEAVNLVLARDSRHGRFMTMILVVVDPVEGVIRWASAGHDMPIVLDASTGLFLNVDGGDLPLGVAEETKYEEYSIPGLKPGTVLLIGTDGIWGAGDEKGGKYGKERLCEVVLRCREMSSGEIMAKVEESLGAFCGKQKAADDITMVVMRIEPLGVPSEVVVTQAGAPGQRAPRA